MRHVATLYVKRIRYAGDRDESVPTFGTFAEVDASAPKFSGLDDDALIEEVICKLVRRCIFMNVVNAAKLRDTITQALEDQMKH